MRIKTRGVYLFLIALMTATISVIPATSASAAGPNVADAQRILKKFGIPAGPVDGQNGPQTARGLCAFRYIAGLTVSRSNLDTATYTKLRQYNTKYASLQKIRARTGSEALLVQKKCQAMIYAKNGYYQRVFAVSTGGPGKATPNGSFSLGYTQIGWSCSTLYPENCRNHTEGRFASRSKFGNMYNKRHVTGSIFVHGSSNVPTYPGSAGCVRISPADADWMYDHVGNSARPTITITGAY